MMAGTPHDGRAVPAEDPGRGRPDAGAVPRVPAWLAERYVYGRRVASARYRVRCTARSSALYTARLDLHEQRAQPLGSRQGVPLVCTHQDRDAVPARACGPPTAGPRAAVAAALQAAHSD